MRYFILIAQTPFARKSYRPSVASKAQLKQTARLVAGSELGILTAFRLGVVLLTDDELLEMNRSSLGHDYYTDILTFEIDRDEKSLEAELYISVDRARENAQKAGVSVETELVHLVIHGLLHLAGYDDKTPSGKKQMRAKERWYLAKL